MDDREIWVGAVEGNEALRAALALRVQKLARECLARKRIRRGDREDLVQQVLASVFACVERGSEPPRSLPGLVYYRCLSIHRLVRLRGARERGFLERGHEAASDTSQAEEPAELLETRDVEEAVKECQGKLGIELQSVLRLRYLEQRLQREIAAMLSVSEVTVRAWTQRALEHMRACLKAKGLLP